MSKLAAGGMAAATSAVFGSYFGAFGTVGGAAAGSVATTVAARVYQRSLERTRDSVKSKVLPVRKDGAATSLDDQRTIRLSADEPPTGKQRGRPPVKLLLIGTIAIFALGLALVTGVEAVKGSLLLSGDAPGTSIGRIVDPRPAPDEPVPSTEVVPSPSTPDDPGSTSGSDRSGSRSDDGSGSDNGTQRRDLIPDTGSGSSGSSGSGSSRPSDSNDPGLLPNLGTSGGSGGAGGGLLPQPNN
ncbi:MAG TPA: hypothetical protein VGH99_14075 [Pseudonocardia sp.]